jgi:hypothetical protein
MKELSAFKRISLLKCCDIGSRMTHFGLPSVNASPFSSLCSYLFMYMYAPVNSISDHLVKKLCIFYGTLFFIHAHTTIHRSVTHKYGHSLSLLSPQD